MPAAAVQICAYTASNLHVVLNQQGDCPIQGATCIAEATGVMYNRFMQSPADMKHVWGP